MKKKRKQRGPKKPIRFKAQIRYGIPPKGAIVIV